MLQEMKNIHKINSVYYWTNEFTSEVDFVFSYKNLIIPVEAKAGINVKSKRLKVFMDEYKTKLAIRYSLLNVTLDNNLLNIPLYAIWNTENYLSGI